MSHQPRHLSKTLQNLSKTFPKTSHLGKVYFPDFEGCLQRNHYPGNLSWHWTGSAIKIKAAQAVWPFRIWFLLYAIGENRLCFFLSSLSVSELRCCVCAIEKSIDNVRSSKGILTHVFPIIACFIESRMQGTTLFSIDIVFNGVSCMFNICV